MQLNLYNKYYEEFFVKNTSMQGQIETAVNILKKSERVFFIGNGGSNSVCSHMMEDYFKMGRFPTFAFSDAALITCFANDYGYENAMAEWLKLHFKKTDLLVSMSSSGESKNILNGTKLAKDAGGKVITLTGFKEGNALSKMGDLNFHLPVSNFGIAECFHQVILHVVLDTYVSGK